MAVLVRACLQVCGTSEKLHPGATAQRRDPSAAATTCESCRCLWVGEEGAGGSAGVCSQRCSVALSPAHVPLTQLLADAKAS